MKAHPFFIVMVFGHFAIQMAVPVYYYLFQEDKLDERFTWRMFSDTSSGDKELVFEGIAPGDPLPIVISREEYFSKDWNNILIVGRKSTIRKAREFLCKTMPYFSRMRSTLTFISWDGKKDVHIEETECATVR